MANSQCTPSGRKDHGPRLPRPAVEVRSSPLHLRKLSVQGLQIFESFATSERRSQTHASVTPGWLAGSWASGPPLAAAG